MSSIPYNYGSYIDAKVSMTNAGTVDSGKQMQSPASAGSRGLAKTTQFTNDRTQMQMGNSPIAESMVEIRNILNRIDGVNAPVQEDAGLTDEQKKGLEAIAKKYSGRKGVNGDPLIRGWITARTDSGVTSDGWDSEEVEAWEKRTGKELSDWSPEDDKQFISRSEISRDMEDELLKVMGDDDFFNKPIAGEVLDFLDDLSESYQPFPEGDEFDIAEDEDFEEVLGPLGFPEDETELFDAEYQGRKVPLNKPMRGDTKKFKVYVKDPKTGNVKKVNFGHGGTSAKRKTMRIRKSNPKARKSFRARHNCANPGPKTKARYWSCRNW